MNKTTISKIISELFKKYEVDYVALGAGNKCFVKM